MILAFNTLHVLEDAQGDIRRISGLLIPGGLFISATPCLGQKSESFFWRILLPPLRILLLLANRARIAPYVRFLKVSEVDSLVASGGLETVEAEILSENPAHYLVVARKL